MKYWLTPIHLKYEIKRRLEKMLIWFVWRLPRTLVKWCTVRVFAHATTHPYGDTHPDDVGYSTVMKRWEHNHG